MLRFWLPVCAAAILVALHAVHANVQYEPSQCASTCSNGDFIEELPEDGPDQGENRAYAWHIIALNQIRDNLAILTPPGAGRACGLVGACLYEAVAVAKRFGDGNSRRRPRSDKPKRRGGSRKDREDRGDRDRRKDDERRGGPRRRRERRERDSGFGGFDEFDGFGENDFGGEGGDGFFSQGDNSGFPGGGRRLRQDGGLFGDVDFPFGDGDDFPDDHEFPDTDPRDRDPRDRDHDKDRDEDRDHDRDNDRDKDDGEKSDNLLDDTMDGAAYWALRALFGNRGSFPKVREQFERYSGRDLDTLTRRLTTIESFPYDELTKDYGRGSARNLAFLVGAASCKRIVDKFTQDGFEPDGTLGGGPDPTNYQPVNRPQELAGITNCEDEIVDIGRWQPLCVPNQPGGFGTTDCTVQEFLAPQAGRFTPFALQDGDDMDGDDLVGPPPKPGSRRFKTQYEEVLNFSANLDDVGKIIAEFWADGPDSTAPPGHWWKIAGDAARGEGLSTSETARLLWIVGSAIYDAGIGAWRTKTTYDFVRPLQMIQCGNKRGQTALMWSGPYMGVRVADIDTWRPYQAATFVTPGFAAYVSGHSTFSSAAAEAMKLFFKDDRYRGPLCHRTPEGESLFEPRSNVRPGFSDIPNSGKATIGYVPRSDVVLCWDTFTDAAVQAGISRLYGGIHIRADDTGGQKIGRAVGRRAFNKAQSLKAPSDF